MVDEGGMAEIMGASMTGVGSVAGPKGPLPSPPERTDKQIRMFSDERIHTETLHKSKSG